MISPCYIVPRGSGFSIPVIALASTMKFFLPLAVAVFAGESVAGEAAWEVCAMSSPALWRGPGTWAPSWRWRPCSRSWPSWWCLWRRSSPAAWRLGGTRWPQSTGAPQACRTSPRRPSAPSPRLGRLAIGTAYVAAGMTSILAFAFLLSTLTSRPFVAVAGGVGLTVVSRVLNGDYLPGVAVLSRYMPNNDVDLWQHFFQQRAQTAGMVHFLVLQVAYVAVFLALAWWWFLRRDILV